MNTATEKHPSIFGLHYQQQPTTKTCVQTCLAIALGVPVEKVIEHFGDDAMNQELLVKALTECGIFWNQFSIGTMLYRGWYFAVAPSLNHRGLNHQLLVRWTPENGLTVIDPAIGERYKPDGSDLKSFECLTPFIPGGKLPSRE